MAITFTYPRGESAIALCENNINSCEDNINNCEGQLKVKAKYSTKFVVTQCSVYIHIIETLNLQLQTQNPKPLTQWSQA